MYLEFKFRCVPQNPCPREPCLFLTLGALTDVSGSQPAALSMSNSTDCRLLHLLYSDVSVSFRTSTGHTSFIGSFVCSFCSFIHQTFDLLLQVLDYRDEQTAVPEHFWVGQKQILWPLFFPGFHTLSFSLGCSGLYHSSNPTHSSGFF